MERGHNDSAAKRAALAIRLSQRDGFRGVPKDQIEALIEGAESVVFGADSLIIEKGDQGDAMFLIESGECQAFLPLPSGEKILRVLSDGEIFGEVGLLTGGERTASVRALTDVELLSISAERFSEQVRREPGLKNALWGSIAHYAYEATDRLKAFDVVEDDAPNTGRHRARELLYPGALVALFATWTIFMIVTDRMSLMAEHWDKALTMVLGSFVAGSTPAGGGAVAFPVFTKLLGVPVSIARDHSLMIQSIGMVMATLFIIGRGIPVYTRIIKWALPAGIVGLLVGTLWIEPGLDPLLGRVLFSSIVLVFGIAYGLAHWVFKFETSWELPPWDSWKSVLFVVAGVLGGIVVSVTGSGIDLICFIAMALGFGLDERRAVPTTVIIMASLSVVGTLLRLMKGVGDAEWETTFQYWIVCVPIVAVGAPMGAFVASCINRHILVGAVLLLIGIDAVTTVLMMITKDASQTIWVALVLTVVLSLTGFGAFLRMRQRRART